MPELRETTTIPMSNMRKMPTMPPRRENTMKPTQPGRPNRYYCNNENCPEEWHNTPNYHTEKARKEEQDEQEIQEYYKQDQEEN